MRVVKFKDEFGEEQELELSKEMVVASNIASLICNRDTSTHLDCYFLVYDIFAILKRNGVSLKGLKDKESLSNKKKGIK